MSDFPSNDRFLSGRTALITGGSRGLGFGAAQLLAAEGCHLHIASRTAADLEAAKRRITEVHDVDVVGGVGGDHVGVGGVDDGDVLLGQADRVEGAGEQVKLIVE